MQTTLTRYLSFILCATLVVLLLFDFRLSQRGKWMPKDLPVEFGSWYAADMPLSRYALELLGNPPAKGRRYSNLFYERVDAHVIATASFDAYLEPLVIWAGNGYALTAEKKFDIFGKAGSIRAMVLQRVSDSSRMIMYHWIQNEDGTVTTRGSLRHFRDLLPRLQLGATSIFQGKQSCIVRVYTQLHPADKDGRQARRNMNEVARQLYESLRKQGTSGDKPADSIVGPTSREDSSDSSGADIAYLTTPLDSQIPKAQSSQLLPLTTGNTWKVLSQCRYEKVIGTGPDAKTQTVTDTSHDKLVIVGPKKEGDVSGIQMTLYREGKPWRREIYQRKGGTTFLAAMEDESSGLMRLDPPIPLWKEPVKEGQTLMWIGNFKLEKRIFPARSFSRTSSQETVKTPAGTFKAFRIDTIILMSRHPQELRFPMVRWLAPKVGYVSRGFADEGRPAFSELQEFDVK